MAGGAAPQTVEGFGLTTAMAGLAIAQPGAPNATSATTTPEVSDFQEYYPSDDALIKVGGAAV